MDHSDFLLIVAPEWTKLENVSDLVYSYGEESLLANIVQGMWGTIEGLLESGGFVFPGQTVAEAKMFTFGTDPQTRLQLWIRLVPTVYS